MSNFEYRDSQVRAVDKMLTCYEKMNVNNIILNGPTGVGKSGIAYLLHEELSKIHPGHKTTIFCNQKLLQDQYADFLEDKEGSIMVMKGKSNYICFRDEKTPVDQAPCQHGIKCRDQAFCEYWQRRAKIKTVPLLIINYHMVLSLMDTATGWTRESNLCIYDESHSIADIITDYYKVTASNTEVPYYNKIYKTLEGNKYFESIRSGLDSVMHYLSAFRIDDPEDTMINLFQSRVMLHTDLTNMFTSMSYELTSNHSIMSVLSILLSKEDVFCTKCRNWYGLRDTVRFVPDYQKSDESVSYTLTPLTVDTLVEPFLKELSKRRVFMSATIFPRVFMKYIGLSEDYHHLQLPCLIPVNNRRVIISPVASFNNSNLNDQSEEFKDLILTILDLLGIHSKEGDSGVIFTPSYKLSTLLKKKLEFNAAKLGYKILINYGADGRDNILESFRNTTLKRRLLISPSFSEGVNFEDDISRFQIMVKAPFKSLADAHVREKMNFDKEWFELDCLMKVIQSLGRSCRHNDDRCVSYVLDGNILRLYKRYKQDVPRWFKEAVTEN